MGYTHYWRNPKGFTTEQWETAQELAKAIIKSSSVPVQYEDDIPDPPQIDSEAIRFNGVEDDGHETFSVNPGPNNFEFCKTAHKPYDEIVVAMLLMLEHVSPSFSWSSDGEGDEHRDGAELFNRVLAGRSENG